MCESQQLGRGQVRRPTPVLTRRHAVHAVDHQATRSELERQLTSGEAGGPQVVLALDAVLVADGRSLVEHTGCRVEMLVRLEEPNREVGGEGGERQPPAGSDGGPNSVADVRIVTAEQTEAALAQTDDGVEPTDHRRVEVAYVSDREPRVELGRLRGGAGQRDEVRRQIEPGDRTASPGERKGVAARTAADVEHRRTGDEVQRVDEELDLLVRSQRERVPQIRRPEERRDFIEPTRCGPVAHLASAQLGPKPTSTVSGTVSSVTDSMADRTRGSISSRSSSGTSKTSSSCTVRIIRLASSARRSAASTSIIASLKMSAAPPWTGAFWAMRSPI